MPVCEIIYPENLLSSSDKDRIAERLCPLLLEAEGLADTAVARSLCLINMIGATSTYLGGAPSAEGKIVVKIHGFANACSDAAKSRLYREITQVFCDEHPASRSVKGSNVWCLVLALEPGNFGAGGIPVSLAMTRALAAAGQSSPASGQNV